MSFRIVDFICLDNVFPFCYIVHGVISILVRYNLRLFKFFDFIQTGGPSCEQLILLSVAAERFEMRHKHVEAFPDTPCLLRTYSYASHAADA